MNFEKRIGRMEEIVSKMESGELSLEDSLKLFEEGVSLSRECHKELETAELKVQTLLSVDDSGKPIVGEFKTP